jgi:short-subunit dehydrogenase
VEQGIALHTLVNNAGFGGRGRFATLPADLLDEMIRVNVSAVTGLSRMFLPGMLARGEGGILNVASMAAFQAGPFMGVYFATKSYVLSISEAIYEENLGRGVTISVLCPGPVATEFAEVADIEGSRLFKKARDVKSVARDGYRGYRAGRLIVIPGIFNRLGIFFSRFAPRALARKVSGKLHRVGA